MIIFTDPLTAKDGVAVILEHAENLDQIRRLLVRPNEWHMRHCSADNQHPTSKGVTEYVVFEDIEQYAEWVNCSI